MIVHSINDLSNVNLVTMLKENLSIITDADIIKNYHPDYSEIPGNLFYILKQGRYKTGNYLILEDDGKYLGSAGWNELEYEDEIVALLLTRAYLMPGYRNSYLMSKYFLPRIFKEVKNYKKQWFSFNEHNVDIYNTLSKLSVDRGSGSFSSSTSPWRRNYSHFKPIGQKVIYNTLQHVMEYKLTS